MSSSQALGSSGSVPSSAEEDEQATNIEKMYTSARFCSDSNAYTQLLNFAVKDNNYLAMAYLSILYEKGSRHLVQDKSKALEYANKSLPWVQAEAIRGNKYAQFLYGFCLNDGRGVEKNEAEAVRYFTLAANQNHAQAQFYLGDTNKINLFFSYIS